MPLLWALVVVCVVAALGVVAAIAAMIAKRWPLAFSLARGSTLISLIAFGVPLLILLLTVLAPQAMVGFFKLVVPPPPPDAVDPSQTARVLAQGISELLNSGALGLPVAIVGGALWAIASRRIAKPTSS